MTIKKALLMVDLQNDFCEGGSLAVPGGQEIIEIANELQPMFEEVIATLDWHPHDHVSFARSHQALKIGDFVTVENIKQRLWPVHCVQDSQGAELHPRLNTRRITKKIYKGTEKKIDSYSAFFDNAHLRSTGLDEYLKANNVQEVYVLGLATDYCVKYTALDALKLGYEVFVIADACRGVNINHNDVDEAYEEMRKAGIEISCVKAIYAAN